MPGRHQIKYLLQRLVNSQAIGLHGDGVWGYPERASCSVHVQVVAVGYLALYLLERDSVRTTPQPPIDLTVWALFLPTSGSTTMIAAR